MMREGHYYFSSESVAEGHPDKICDQISDSILDAFLIGDTNAKVAVEAMVMPNHVVLAGEVRSEVYLSDNELEEVVRNKIKDLGYNRDRFNWQDLKILNFLQEQSPDIAMGVDKSLNKAEGAGDQGMMFGYACRETEHLMPAAITYSHLLLKNVINDVRKGIIKGLYYDAKAQLTLEYDAMKRPVRAQSIVFSIHHESGIAQQEIASILKPYMIATLPENWIDEDTQIFINPTGRFVIGGPESDCGLTGRKIIVDTYGGAVPHGGGAFSGKDPSKVDRSAAYAARYLAKNIVANELADQATVQLAYAIGVAQPVSIYVNTYGTGKIPDHELVKLLPQAMDLTPRGIRDHLNLDRPIYTPTATYGHFGRDANDEGYFPWERLDLALL